jgi:hypothetical protein
MATRRALTDGGAAGHSPVRGGVFAGTEPTALSRRIPGAMDAGTALRKLSAFAMPPVPFSTYHRGQSE